VTGPVKTFEERMKDVELQICSICGVYWGDDPECRCACMGRTEEEEVTW
jgi:hypothetical protein